MFAAVIDDSLLDRQRKDLAYCVSGRFQVYTKGHTKERLNKERSKLSCLIQYMRFITIFNLIRYEQRVVFYNYIPLTLTSLKTVRLKTEEKSFEVSHNKLIFSVTKFPNLFSVQKLRRRSNIYLKLLRWLFLGWSQYGKHVAVILLTSEM